MAFPVQIQRSSKAELDRAIEDLEKRGFKLVKIKEAPYRRKFFNRDDYNRFRYSDTVETSSWQALLVKEGSKCNAANVDVS